MADKLYKVGESISLGYQAPNKQSGLVDADAPIAEIYDETGVKDLVNFSDVALVEVASTGTYRGEFIPDVVGTWQIIMHKADGDGQVTRSFSVGLHNVHSVGESIVAVDSAVGTVNDAVDAVDVKVLSVAGQIIDLDAVVDGVGVTIAADIATLDAVVDGVGSAVANLDTEVVAVAGQVTAVDAKVDSRANNTDAKIDALDTKVSALDTPPMAF